jgi:hypothetical protein
MKRTVLEAVAALVLLVVGVSVTLHEQQHTSLARVITDVSWPNCKEKSVATAEGIVGITGGLDFTPNKCLGNEVNWFSSTALYMNTGWPGTNFHLQYPHSPLACAATDSNCLAYNYGYHAALYAIHYADSQLVANTQWWLDVETDNSWTNDPIQNAAALIGMVEAIQQNTFSSHVGFYSSAFQWGQIVGNWRPNLPAWVATGSTSEAVAKRACLEPSFTAGQVVFSQYTLRLDENYLC